MIRERRSYDTLLAAAEETSVANIDTVDKIEQRIRRVLTGVGFVEQSFAIFCFSESSIRLQSAKE